ncbi:hypothetical protein [Candidatus Nitrospira bockiana]
MLLAGAFAAFLLLALIITDWWHFTSLSPQVSDYGCRVARRQDVLSAKDGDGLGRFDRNGLLRLPHGIARLFQAEKRIVLRPLFSMRFRTAWPLKATIDVSCDGDTLRLTCTKRMPWSSVLLTLTWFAVVAVGSAAFLVSFGLDGGFATLGGTFLGIGIAALGLLVLAFGLIVVALAYRLEDHRLTQAYQELQAALTIPDP